MQTCWKTIWYKICTMLLLWIFFVIFFTQWKWYTVPFFVSGQTYKISKGSVWCSHIMEHYSRDKPSSPKTIPAIIAVECWGWGKSSLKGRDLCVHCTALFIIHLAWTKEGKANCTSAVRPFVQATATNYSWIWEERKERERENNNGSRHRLKVLRSKTCLFARLTVKY